MNTEFKYNLNESDFVQSNLDYVKIAPNFAKQMRIIKWGFTAVIMILMAIFIEGTVGVLIAVGVGVLYLVSFDWYYRSTVKRKVLKTIKKGDVTLYENGLTMVVSEAGVVIKGKKEKPKYTWKDITMVVNAPEHVYIFASDGTAEVLPKKDQDMALIQSEILDRAKRLNKEIKNI